MSQKVTSEAKTEHPLLRRLEESVRLLELRRYHRIFAAMRLPLVYSVGVVLMAWMVVPLFFGVGGVLAGRMPIFAYRGWAAGTLLTTSALGAALGAYLRGQAIWLQERQMHTLHNWLLTYQNPARAAGTTVVMAALLGTGLVALPALLGAVLGLTAGLSWWQVLLPLLLIPLCALAGGATGGAVFFVNQGLAPRRLAYPLGVALALLVLGAWLRAEAVQNGWRRPWEEHPGRFVQAAALVTPVPYLFGATAPRWWSAVPATTAGLPVPAWGGSLGYAGFLLIFSAAVGMLVVRGYQRVAADPECLEEQPRDTPSEEGGREFYWRGFRNPVLTREVRTRLRSRETAEFVFFASVAVAAGAFVPLLATTRDLSDPLQMASAARQVFFWLTMTLVALVALVAPGLTSETVAAERVRGTLESLVETPLRPREILGGKLLGAAAVLLLLLSPSLPLFGLCYLFHGCSGGQVAGVFGLLTLTVMVACLLGVTQSSIHPKPGMAKFWAYTCTAVFVAFPGGPLWLAALAAAPDPGFRQALSLQAQIGAMMSVFYLGFLVLFWGNACEQLEYSEY